MDFELDRNEVDQNTQQQQQSTNAYGEKRNNDRNNEEKIDVYYDGLRYLKNNDYLCLPSPSGPWSMHQVKVKRKLTNLAFKDLNIKDDEFEFWDEMKNKDEHKEFKQKVKELIDKGTSYKMIWEPIICPTNEDPLANTAIREYKADLQIESRSGLTPPYTLNEPFPVKNQSPPKSWIPNKDWFPDSVKNLTIDDICKLVPHHERKMLSLTIGRAIIGKGNQYTANGTYIPDHTFRSCVVLLGEPGLGKSVFFDYLLNSLKLVGYDVSTFGDINSRFNMGEVATSDIIYKDDISNNPLAKFLQSETAKIIITSKGYLRCEDKGVDAINVPPKGAMIINANEFNPRSIYNTDPGMADRVKIISTYTKRELDELSQSSDYSYYPEKRIEQLAEKCDVSTTTIMLWYARLCADYFYSLISDNQTNQLYKEVSYLTTNLRFSLRKDTTTQIISFLIYQIMLIEFNENESYVDWDKMKNKNIASIEWGKLFKLIQSNISISLNDGAINYIKSNYNSNENWLNSFHPYVGYSWVSIPHYKKVLNTAVQKDSSELEDPNVLENLLKEMKPADCTELQSDLGWLNKCWQRVSYGLDYLQELALDASDHLV